MSTLLVWQLPCLQGFSTLSTCASRCGCLFGTRNMHVTVTRARDTACGADHIESPGCFLFTCHHYFVTTDPRRKADLTQSTCTEAILIVRLLLIHRRNLSDRIPQTNLPPRYYFPVLVNLATSVELPCLAGDSNHRRINHGETTPPVGGP